MPPRKVINPLFSFLYHGDESVRWAAISCMAAVLAKLACEDMEAARVIIRRLMWNLNDESGGIGWGAPEALGEIMARHKGLAKEYAHILISYIRKDGNFLEDERLQRGLLWGIGRMCQACPQAVKSASEYLTPFLGSPDDTLRGLAAWIMGLADLEKAGPRLRELLDDPAEIYLYLDRKLVPYRVGDLAKEALNRLDSTAERRRTAKYLILKTGRHHKQKPS
jgi:hypothetical protein